MSESLIIHINQIKWWGKVNDMIQLGLRSQSLVTFLTAKNYKHVQNTYFITIFNFKFNLVLFAHFIFILDIIVL